MLTLLLLLLPLLSLMHEEVTWHVSVTELPTLTLPTLLLLLTPLAETLPLPLASFAAEEGGLGSATGSSASESVGE